MSSDEDDYGPGFHRKRRRVQRACDNCRRRKTRCDGAQMAGGKCSTCIEAKIECKYVEIPAKVPTRSYVDALEARLDHSENLVRQLRTELADLHFARSSSAVAPKTTIRPEAELTEKVSGSETIDGLHASLFLARMMLRSLAAPPPPPHADDLQHLELIDKFQFVSLKSNRTPPFLGKSSQIILVDAALNLKADVRREEEIGLSEGDNNAWKWCSPRPYWSWRPYENMPLEPKTSGHFKFPAEPLMSQFIDLYFIHQNIYLPVLHRPTFQRGIADDLHLRDDGFAATVLLVCAIGSRWSTDASIAEKGLACGWEWFKQVAYANNPLFKQAGLYDLQYYCLAAQFLNGAFGPQSCWTCIGVGLRLAQDLGVHRRKARVEVPSAEHELLKRCFWVLVFLDRVVSGAIGRACALQYEDFDCDELLAVDDEYWDHPTHPFVQPAGVPSTITYFTTLTRLNHLLAYSLKALYSLNKLRALIVEHDSWEEHVIPEIDSALNSWHEQIPEHLRWDPAREHSVFFAQSVALHCWYHCLQILIHRPFIPMFRKSSSMAMPAMTICTGAARACVSMVDIQRQRMGNIPVLVNVHAVFTSAIVLLLNVWSSKRNGRVSDTNRDLLYVQKCMEVARLCEGRWQTAGLMCDILAELASVGKLTLVNPNVERRCEGRESERAPESSSDSTSDRLIQVPQFRSYSSPEETSSEATSANNYRSSSEMEPSTFASPSASDAEANAEAWSAPYYTSFEAGPNQAPAHNAREFFNMFDRDTIAMWSNAPTSLEVNDWGAYFSNFNEITQTRGDTNANERHASRVS
ncbi:Zn(2)-C6 fungal-type domain-containing protein [Favolaschia claudopus]|uniref:Zn(2)-C6 fungal-type domain-containing protein n=1 Tax=Favolaschia claudopus TaxID=2862362 RepID=A0AAW0AVB1_9AGAR